MKMSHEDFFKAIKETKEEENLTKENLSNKECGHLIKSFVKKLTGG